MTARKLYNILTPDLSFSSLIPLSSPFAICGTHTRLPEMWCFPDSLFPVLCTFLFVWNKLLSTLHAHPASYDSSFRIWFKHNHVPSLRKPFQFLYILVTSLSYILSCYLLCISIITLYYLTYRFYISNC